MSLYPNLYAGIIFNYTDLRSGLECNHLHNILQLSCALLEDSSYAEYWSRQKMQGPPSSMMAHQGPFLLTINHSDEQKETAKSWKSLSSKLKKVCSEHLDWQRSALMNLEFIWGPAHKTFPYILFHFAITISKCNMKQTCFLHSDFQPCLLLEAVFETGIY
jgi:hypothetical protein